MRAQSQRAGRDTGPVTWTTQAQPDFTVMPSALVVAFAGFKGKSPQASYSLRRCAPRNPSTSGFQIGSPSAVKIKWPGAMFPGVTLGENAA